jgi:hypothetical protein
MKSLPPESLYDLPMSELRARVDRARSVLREMRMRSQRGRGAALLSQTIDALERLVPGLLARPVALLPRTLAGLVPHERQALRRAIEAERRARQQLAHLLGDVSPAAVEDMLARVEAHEALAADVQEFMWSFEHSFVAPMLA